mmetsp:Transcript_14869/g.32104  ORF Transcript_14869/g.32104 Transcript_14869/m.32104 type:complete len:200 (+) Transcript_14869:903-1502(+)
MVPTPQRSMAICPGKPQSTLAAKLPAPRASKHPLRAVRSSSFANGAKKLGKASTCAGSKAMFCRPKGKSAAAAASQAVGSSQVFCGAATAVVAAALAASGAAGRSVMKALQILAVARRVASHPRAKKVQWVMPSGAPPGNSMVGNITCTGTKKTGSHRIIQATPGINAEWRATACAGATREHPTSTPQAPSMPPIWVGR